MHLHFACPYLIFLPRAKQEAFSGRSHFFVVCLCGSTNSRIWFRNSVLCQKVTQKGHIWSHYLYSSLARVSWPVLDMQMSSQCSTLFFPVLSLQIQGATQMYLSSFSVNAFHLSARGLKIQLSVLRLASDVIGNETVRAKDNCLSPGQEDLKEKKTLFWGSKSAFKTHSPKGTVYANHKIRLFNEIGWFFLTNWSSCALFIVNLNM